MSAATESQQNATAACRPELVRAAVDAYLATPESFPLVAPSAMKPRLDSAWQKADRRRFATEPEPITGFGELTD